MGYKVLLTTLLCVPEELKEKGYHSSHPKTALQVWSQLSGGKTQEIPCGEGTCQHLPKTTRALAWIHISGRSMVLHVLPRFCRASSIGTPSSSSILLNQKCVFKATTSLRLVVFHQDAPSPPPVQGSARQGWRSSLHLSALEAPLFLSPTTLNTNPGVSASPWILLTTLDISAQFCHFTLSRVRIWDALGHAEDAELK